jgi:hypothetical protein
MHAKKNHRRNAPFYVVNRNEEVDKARFLHVEFFIVILICTLKIVILHLFRKLGKFAG